MHSVEELCSRFDKKKNDRTTLDNHCQEIAVRVFPQHAYFNDNELTMGSKRNQKIYDETAMQALDRFVSAFTSMIVPEGTQWHYLRTDNEYLNKNPRVREYFELSNKILFRERYRGGFGHQIQEHWRSLGAFGTGALMVEGARGGGLWYKSVPMYNFWVGESNEGKIDEIFRKFKLTARAAYQEFGDNLHPDVKDMLNDKPDTIFEFLQVVTPNIYYDGRKMDYRGMKYLSYHIDLKHKHVCRVGGYNTFPIPVSRFSTISGEPYGYSPAMTVLQTIKTVNEMAKTVLRAAHLNASPPWLATDDLLGASVGFKPAHVNYGGLDQNGNQRIQPMVTGVNHGLAEDALDKQREIINNAFFLSLFQILVESHTMSATEVVERAREKAALLSPTFSRQTDELLEPVIERELNILQNQGKLPEMPAELIEAQGEYEVVYDNPLGRAQRSEALVALARTFEIMLPMAQQDPSILMNYDFDAIAKDIPEITGMPSSWIRSKEVVDMMKKQQQQAMQAQQMLEAAPILANTRKTELEAQQIAQAGPAGRV